MPHQMNTSANTSTKTCETMRSSALARAPSLRPDVDFEMRTFAHADHGAEHDHPDEHETRQFLGPDIGGINCVKREKICSVTGTIRTATVATISHVSSR